MWKILIACSVLAVLQGCNTTQRAPAETIATAAPPPTLPSAASRQVKLIWVGGSAIVELPAGQNVVTVNFGGHVHDALIKTDTYVVIQNCNRSAFCSGSVEILAK
jgi:ABC-type uncharacterized transport system auxiliary subunit